MNQNFDMVRAFHVAFGAPVAPRPAMLPAERSAARCKWLREEIDEFLAAPDLCAQTDAMIDLIYFALGTLVEMGVKPDEAFGAVHEANMAKLWENGEIRRDADGKVIKPPSWRGPEEKIKNILARYANGGESSAL